MSKILIGIDPGVNTGFAISQDGKLLRVDCWKVHQIMEWLRVATVSMNQKAITVYVEDARKRKWFGKASAGKLQGAGSIKRDCQIWEDFLTETGIPFVLVDPKDQKGLTKWDAKTFKQKTGWQGRTNEHGRDAALLIWGL